MKKLHMLLAFCILATAGVVQARIVKEAEVGKLTVKHYAANGELYRVETTTRDDNGNFVTVITDEDGNHLGRIDRTVLSTRALPDGKGEVMTTRNYQTDAAGNYLRTTYSIIVIDEDGNLAAITDTKGARDSADISISTLLDERDFVPVTTGNF